MKDIFFWGGWNTTKLDNKFDNKLAKKKLE